jgi:hypothetical protein
MDAASATAWVWALRATQATSMGSAAVSRQANSAQRVVIE